MSKLFSYRSLLEMFGMTLLVRVLFPQYWLICSILGVLVLMIMILRILKKLEAPAPGSLEHQANIRRVNRVQGERSAESELSGIADWSLLELHGSGPPPEE